MTTDLPDGHSQSNQFLETLTGYRVRSVDPCRRQELIKSINGPTAFARSVPRRPTRRTECRLGTMTANNAGIIR
jgi:hypothetical protein